MGLNKLGSMTGAVMLCAAVSPGLAQKSIGSVSTADATVANSGGGVVEASAGRATMRGSSTVTAKDRTAAVSLTRGGEVKVCRSTAVHLTGSPDDSLQLALDRGALEIRTKAMADDVLVTPDLRFTFSGAGSLDLQVRVVANGDTCVDNRQPDAPNAPTLKITDAFGEASYQLKPGQHVMFEHGNLRQVVDRETTPCGCPPDAQQGMSLADAALAGGSRTGPATPQKAADAHPFPSAVSEGLEEPAAPPPQPAGTTHVQVASTLAYDPDAPKNPERAAPEPVAEAQPAAKKRSTGGPLGAIGRFFKHIFVR